MTEQLTVASSSDGYVIQQKIEGGFLTVAEHIKSEAKAQRIIHCFNNFDKLVEKLNITTDALEYIKSRYQDEAEDFCEVAAHALEALQDIKEPDGK